MIKVSVKFFASLSEIFGDREITVSLAERKNFQDLFNKLEQRYGEKFQETLFQSNGNFKESYKILLNENNVRDENLLEIKLENNDIIAFLPPVGGGC